MHTYWTAKISRIGYKVLVKFRSRASIFCKNQTDFCLKKFFGKKN